ncbi:SusC/RagA family TonB-linked outer membrane protein [Leadbetterella byssophila]|uniref:SusC/RagA family TonB-linked outer membrane protein n=1 Tax=Leadbetterella byssophila TaxID=316068 RepID=UPI0039A1C8F0
MHFNHYQFLKERSVYFCLTVMLLFSIVGTAFGQNTTIRGKVTEDDGSPLPGVAVSVKSQNIGIITDAEGNYSLSVPRGCTLIFSMMGYTAQEITLTANQTALNVVMKLSDTQLEEMVVVGYGTQRKEAVTGSVVSIKSDQITEVPAANITQALQGRLAGVEMAQASSKPGAGMQVRIRGTRSLNASNDPLIVLDGIPFAGSLNDINPTTIERVDILKDASATAIYGSRGANGVLLITTNKGKPGQKSQLHYSNYVGFKKVFSSYPMMSREKFLKLREVANVYQTHGLDESPETNTDWQEMFYGPAMMQNHDLGISGSTESGGNYNFGIGYYKDEAVIPSQNYNRISLRTAFDQKIGNYIQVGLITNNNYAISKGNNLGFYDVLSASPITNPYNTDGTLKRVVRMPLDDQWVRTRETVEALGDSWIDQTKSLGSYNSIYGEAKIPGIKGLSYRFNLGLNYRQSNSGQYTGEGVFSVNQSTTSSASISNDHTTSWTIENLINYDLNIKKHHINLLGLYSAQEDSYHRSSASARDIPADAFQFYNLGRANEQPIINPDGQGYTKSGLISGMGRAIYSFDDRFLLSASYRFDGSSRLAEGHKWISYPAISAGWNLHREKFLENVSSIDRLKLRLGYGVTSNQAVNPYSTLGLLSTRPYNFGSTFATGFYVSELPNPELGWEYSSTMNYGLDFSLFNHVLSGSLEYYTTKTHDLLFRVSLPQTSGVGSYMANIGESQNKGFEFTLNGLLINRPNGLTWEVGFNLYTNRNKLTKLSSGQIRDESNWWFVGYPIDVIYDYQYIGIWQEGDPYLNILEPGGNVGMIKVKYTGDYNADGTPTRAIGPADRQIMSMQPNFQGGFNTRLAYKNFDLTLVGAFKNGGLLIATPYGANGYLNILTGRRGNIDVDYWTPENTNARFPKPGGIGGDQPKYLNSLSYFDASYLKVRTITLGYNFEQSKWFNVKGISRLRFYATVQNPFVLFSPYHKFSGMDPETNSYANENSAVGYSSNLRRLLTIGTNTPTTRNYVFGLNLTF